MKVCSGVDVQIRDLLTSAPVGSVALSIGFLITEQQFPNDLQML
jgi:hypothetical protein